VEVVMNWETVKQVKDAQLEGVTVEIDKADGRFHSVVVTDAKGKKLRVRYESYSMAVEVPAPPKTEKKFVLQGEYKGLKVSETFDSEHAATNRRYDLDDSLTIQETEVEIPF
jgi:hypothetical protein